MGLVRHPSRALSAFFGSITLVVAFTVLGAGTASAGTSTLRVGCGHGSYPTVGAAVSAAASGATIIVCPGTYPGGVVVSTTVSVVGLGHPVINATGDDNGVQVLASGSRIQGLTVENATGEGILVGSETPHSAPVSDVTVSGNTVKHNDQGSPTSSYIQCQPANGVPGDCGEGIHLVNTFDSTVIGNTSTGNSGGILLSDDTGQTYGNLIEFNNVYNNLFDCGITVAGHTPAFFGGGVHNNKILGNRVTGNGVEGQGGGVLLATAVPEINNVPNSGGAVYDNLVEGNYLAGNGLGGVTLHSHAPGENLNGNTIIGNVIGMNNLDPDQDFVGFGSQFFDGKPTGVILAAASNVSITVARNVIANNVIGIWVGEVLPGVTITAPGPNQYVNVTHDVVTVTPATTP
jgi:Periplasmic copper-binding protein (NosD)